MENVCELDMCTGCMACLDICKSGAVKIADNLKSYNAIIDQFKCIQCGMCYKICPQNHNLKREKTQKWVQGWSRDDVTRMEAASGGVASEVISTFLKNIGPVASCVFEDGEFCFKLIDCYEAKGIFRGSKYVKSNPRGIYKTVKNELRNGKKVLFVGLPCQVDAVKKFCDNNQNLYTVDLICHGTPSPKLLGLFLDNHGFSMSTLYDVKFREKNNFQIHANVDGIYQSIGVNGVSDCFTMAFLNGLCYTTNCYYCKYACEERVGDITLGDSWGSMLPEIERKKGISLVLVQTEKGMELLEKSHIVYSDVDVDNAKKNNKQLSEPATMPFERALFFNKLSENEKYDDIIRKIYPKQYYKQNIKSLLIRLGIL